MGPYSEVELGRLRVERSGSLSGGGTTHGVFRCRAPDGEALLFKEYRPGTRGEVDPSVLRAHVRWRQQLSPADRRRLDALAAWPTAVVREGRTVAGVLMNEAPREFFEDKEPGAVRDLTALARDPDYSARYHAPHFPAPRKLAALGHLLQSLAFLHGLDVVVGDLQPRNVLTTGTTGVPRVYFLDCDAYLVEGKNPFRVVREPEPWRVPGAKTFTERTDLYKAALLVARCLAENLALHDLRPRMFADVLPSVDVDVLRALTAPDRPGRPAMRAAELRPMAQAWQALVREDGAMYVRNDTYAMARWPVPTGPGTARPSRGTPPHHTRTGEPARSTVRRPDTAATPRKGWLRRFLDFFRGSPANRR
ncbi:hypothetical protein [Streptomyces sp. NPDC005435]|uniref:hypothetical protein n=1 Tax=Streptomyces sp. NPDC005435 TaxID=3154464 RepID=UPI003452BA4B